MSETAYKPLTTAQKIFKDLVFDPFVRTGELALEGSVPFFALPVIRNMEEAVINEIANHLYAQWCLLVDIEAIELVNAELQREFVNQQVKLKIIIHDKGMDSDEYKQAREAAKGELSKYVAMGPR